MDEQLSNQLNEKLMEQINNKKDEKLNININITRKEAIVFVIPSAFISILYTICFSGIDVLPQLSFTIFCPVALAALTLTLKHLGMFKNKRAFIWAIPITIISLLNCIFNFNLFTYGNVLVMHILFAIFTFWAIQSQPASIFKSTAIVSTILGNWLVLAASLKKLYTEKDETSNKPAIFKKILLGIVISIPVLIVIVYLLLSADMVFNKLVGKFFNKALSLSFINFSFIISVVLSWIYAAGYIYQAKKACDENIIINLPNTTADVIIGATFLTILNFVFLVFSIIQVAYLFNGGFMTLPDNMVYSQYAREGFFQLLLVTVINFSVLIVFMSILNDTSKSKLLRGLLTSLCCFTGILIASSFYRMFLYIDAYGYTTLRLSVITFLVMEVFLMIITFLKLFNDKIPFIKWFALSGLIFYIIVNFTGSDYFSAKLNVNMFIADKLDYINVLYLYPDEFYVIKPLLQDNNYVCYDNKIYKKSNFTKLNLENSESLLKPLSEVSYSTYNYMNNWQSWSYFKHKANK